MQEQGNKKFDERIKKFAQDALLIPQEIKQFILEKYLHQSKLTHSIAFSQWRYLNSQITFDRHLRFNQLEK